MLLVVRLTIVLAGCMFISHLGCFGHICCYDISHLDFRCCFCFI